MPHNFIYLIILTCGCIKIKAVLNLSQITCSIFKLSRDAVSLFIQIQDSIVGYKIIEKVLNRVHIVRRSL